MGDRRKAREQALQLLYQMDLTCTDVNETLEKFLENFKVRTDDLNFTSEIVFGVTEQREEIDKIIEQHAHNWKLARMAPIDRNLLRLAVFELLFSTATPARVIINEAIEIGKKFGSEQTASFINGILDAVYQTKQKPG